MFKSIKIQLATSKRQYNNLLETVHVFNEACNNVACLAYKKKCFDLECLHQKTYKHIRASYGLTSQMAAQVIRKVVKTYKTHPHTCVCFKLEGAVPYTKSSLSWREHSNMIFIQTLKGRKKIPILLQKYYNYPYKLYKSERNLIFDENVFYVQFIIETPPNCTYPSTNVTTLIKKKE